MVSSLLGLAQPVDSAVTGASLPAGGCARFTTTASQLAPCLAPQNHAGKGTFICRRPAILQSPRGEALPRRMRTHMDPAPRPARPGLGPCPLITVTEAPLVHALGNGQQSMSPVSLGVAIYADKNAVAPEIDNCGVRMTVVSARPGDQRGPPVHLPDRGGHPAVLSLLSDEGAEVVQSALVGVGRHQDIYLPPVTVKGRLTVVTS